MVGLLVQHFVQQAADARGRTARVISRKSGDRRGRMVAVANWLRWLQPATISCRMREVAKARHLVANRDPPDVSINQEALP
jgi:hypothetical protein